MEEEETLPKRKRASRVGCMCAAVRPSCFSMPSMTPRPPVWMQKCSKARPKSGMYALTFMPSTCSEPPRISRPSASIARAFSNRACRHASISTSTSCLG